MSTIDTDVLKAFISLGVPSDMAVHAAALRKRDDALAEVKTTLAVHTWMLGVVITLCIAILGRLLLD